MRPPVRLLLALLLAVLACCHGMHGTAVPDGDLGLKQASGREESEYEEAEEQRLHQDEDAEVSVESPEPPPPQTTIAEILARKKELDRLTDPLGVHLSDEDMTAIWEALNAPQRTRETSVPLSVSGLPDALPYAEAERTSVALLVSSRLGGFMVAPESLQPGMPNAVRLAKELTARAPTEMDQTSEQGCLRFLLPVKALLQEPALLNFVQSSRSCTLSGTVVVKLFLYLSKSLGFRSAKLEDEADLYCRPGTVDDGTPGVHFLKLGFLNLVTHGKSWYGRLGFKPVRLPTKSLDSVLATAKVAGGQFDGQLFTRVVPGLAEALRAPKTSETHQKACAALSNLEIQYSALFEQKDSEDDVSIAEAWNEVTFDLDTLRPTDL